MQEHLTPQETAVTDIAAILNPLPPDEVMAALIEIQAIILAEQGILPRTPEFERFALLSD